MKKTWREIGFTRGKYHISNTGSVKSFAQNRPKILSTQIDKVGYESVKLYIDGSHKRYSVHRLVAKAFISNPNNKPEVNHKNGIKHDNRYSNLEWVTRSENMVHADRNGYLSDKKGYKNPASNFSKADVYEIMSLYPQGWFTQKEIANAYNVHTSTIQRLIYRNQ